MREKSAQMAVWLFFIFLPMSKSSSPNDGESCPIVDMRVVCGKEEGNRNPYCDQKLSKECRREESPYSDTAIGFPCHDTLGEVVLDRHACRERHTEDRCGTIISSDYTSPKKPLVYLRLYHHHDPNTGWGHEARVNVTIPAPTWKELDLQYSTFCDDGGYHNKCRKFTLETAVNSTLMYECVFRRQLGDKDRIVRFTVKSDNDEAASYLFKTPPGTKIDPEETCPSDWHVFFYIHQDAIQHYNPLPVTVQSSPYGQVKYRVVLAKCSVPEDEKCSEYEEKDHHEETKNTTDDLWTVYLPAITNGGNYTVRVQMVADWCEPNGCYVSVSPKFEIPSSSIWIVLTLSICFILMFLVSIVLILYHQMKVNKEFFKRLKSSQPNVLLVYHPESLTALDFVRKLAEFFRNTCCVTSLIVDDEVGTENPSDWTRDKMNDANNRVLFLVPKDSKAQSSTPIRNQWDVALGECNTDQFITSPSNTKRLAVLVHPNSGNVPREIRNVRCFDLSDNPSALANWLHGGSFLDHIFRWLPHIRSSAKKHINPTWKQVKSAADNIGLSRATPSGELVGLSVPPAREIPLIDQEDDNSSHGEDGGDVCRDFDQDIPHIEDIGDGIISSPEVSEDEDDRFFY